MRKFSSEVDATNKWLGRRWTRNSGIWLSSYNHLSEICAINNCRRCGTARHFYGMRLPSLKQNEFYSTIWKKISNIALLKHTWPHKHFTFGGRARRHLRRPALPLLFDLNTPSCQLDKLIGHEHQPIRDRTCRYLPMHNHNPYILARPCRVDWMLDSVRLSQ